MTHKNSGNSQGATRDPGKIIVVLKSTFAVKKGENILPSIYVLLTEHTIKTGSSSQAVVVNMRKREGEIFGA